MHDIRRQLLHEAFKLIDSLLFLSALAATVWVLTESGSLRLTRSAIDSPFYVSEWISLEAGLAMLAMLFVWHLSMASRGLYNPDRMETPLQDSLNVFRGGVLASLVTSLVLVGSIPGLEVDSLRFFVTFFTIATGTTILGRWLMRFVLEHLRLRGRNLRSILVVGTNDRAVRFAETIGQRPELGYFVDGFVDDPWEGIDGFRQSGHQIRAPLRGLGDYLAKNVVDEVVVALPVSRAYLHSKRIISLCQEQGITVRFISQLFDPRLASAKMDLFEDEPMITLRSSGEVGFSKLMKRLLDIVGSAAALVVLALPLALVALTVRFLSPGPVFFVQERIGLNKRPFRLFKFRTMVTDAEERMAEIEHLNEVAGPVFKIEHDPRVTPIGRFLRKSSIDELPQLWNVLVGDMSLVGPRPLPLRDYAGFDDDSHRRRLSVKPGITCSWQVAGRNSIPFEEWMRLDLEYIDRWSFWLDIRILLRTIPVVLGPLFLNRQGEFMGRKTRGESDGPSASKADTPVPDPRGAAKSIVGPTVDSAIEPPRVERSRVENGSEERRLGERRLADRRSGERRFGDRRREKGVRIGVA